MRVFVDTSAFFALLDRDDANHKKAKEIWNKVLNLLIPILKNRVFIAFLKRSREQVFNLNVMRDMNVYSVKTFFLFPSFYEDEFREVMFL